MHSKYGHPNDDYSASLDQIDHYLDNDGSVGGRAAVIEGKGE